MGLSGPKKRTKIAHDPNNNNWAKATDSFGHKILASQGWKPGDTLGARDANHASHYTAGSNSHIRVLLKDDNLGLGAARGSNNAETFGLSLYSGLLGRLNGKSEAQLEKEQGTVRDVELAVWQGRKHGHINFVSAGFLVGDKIQLKSTVMPDPNAKKDSTSAATSAKKRKRSEADEAAAKDSSSDSSSSDSSDDEATLPPKKSKKTKDTKKKSKKSSAKESTSDSTDELKSKDKKRKKDKKEKKRKAADSSSSEDESRAERKARRAERRAKKEEKRKRKEEKKDKKKAASASATPSTTPGTPAEPAQPVVAALYGRQNVRQRYIMQKRLALMNPEALKEIFMVKA